MKSEKEILKEAGHMYSAKTDRAWAAFQENIIGEEEKQFVKKVIYSRPLLFRIAAVFIILLGLAWGVRMWMHSRQHLVQTAWNQKMISLPDGSTVFLNGNSQLIYPGKFLAKTRMVKLQGEAFFKIKKNKRRPFVVKTKNARIQVFGTSFNVDAPEGQATVGVLVKTGIVGLSSEDNQAHPLILHPGEFGLLKDNKTAKSSVPDINYLSWRTKVFHFKQEKLARVVKVLNRAYAKNIILSDDSLQYLQLTSTYNNVGFDTILESICLTFHLKQERSGNKIILGLKN